MPNNIVSFSDAKINQRGKTILKNVSIDVSEGSFVFNWKNWKWEK